MRVTGAILLLLVCGASIACSSGDFSIAAEPGSDAGDDASPADTVADGTEPTDSEGSDSVAIDSGADTGKVDSGKVDSGLDTSVGDTGAVDSGLDTSVSDSGTFDSGLDTSVGDTGAVDSGLDTSVGDTGVLPDVTIGEVSVCPAPTAGELHVAPTGSDVAPANGSPGCPFKTIQRAINAVGANPTRIRVGKGRYGLSCDGGAPCDPSPITVPSSISAGVTIAGQGLTGEVIVSGDGASVFEVQAASVGFESMTINPKKVALGGTGGAGIVYSGPASASERAITKVEIRGQFASDGFAGTGPAIWLKGSASPVIGPAVKLADGFHGVLVQGYARPRITGASTADVQFANFGGACLRVAPSLGSDRPSVVVDSGASTSPFVSFVGCGGSAAIVLDVATGGSSTIDRVVINKGLAGSGGVLVRGAHTASFSGSTINDAQGAAVSVNDTAVLSIERVNAYASLTYGLFAGGTAQANVTTFVANGSGADGIRCEGTARLTLRNSTLLVNKGSGLLVTGGCIANLGSSTAAGNNVFNKTTARNTQAGVCYAGTAGAPIAASSTWSCNRLLGGCTSLLDVPTRATPPPGVLCATSVDISQPSGATVGAPNPTCCN